MNDLFTCDCLMLVKITCSSTPSIFEEDCATVLATLSGISPIVAEISFMSSVL